MQNNRPPVSTSKQEYLQSGNLESYQLRASNLIPITDHYDKKLDLQIHINGSTELYNPNKEKKQEAIQQKIDQLNDAKLKYAIYLQQHFSDLRTDREAIKNAIKDFLTESGSFIKNMTDEQLLQLNKICENNLSESVKSKLNDKISLYISDLYDKKSEASIELLTKNMVLNEIEFIQKNLKEGECAGYIFTNGATVERQHFEVLIITRESIIKPVNFNVDTDREINRSDFHSQSLFSPNIPYLSGGVENMFLEGPLPQSGEYECGTLGMLYLKELMKDGAHQLHESTLQFPYYNDKGILTHFFLPSPHVLRYSQSSFFNEVIKTMLNDADTASVSTRGKTVEFYTIKKMLENTIERANARGEQDIVETCQKILDKLPEFRNQWLAEYKISMENRDRMRDKDSLNRYLAYRTRTMENKAKPLQQTAENGKQLIKSLDDFKQASATNPENSDALFKQIFEDPDYRKRIIKNLDDLYKACIFLKKEQAAALAEIYLRDENREEFRDIYGIDKDIVYESKPYAMCESLFHHANKRNEWVEYLLKPENADLFSNIILSHTIEPIFKGCELYLSNDKPLKTSNLNQLYLYKDKIGAFYCINDNDGKKKIYMSNEVNELLKNESFDQANPEKPKPCDKANICITVLTESSNNGHTLSNTTSYSTQNITKIFDAIFSNTSEIERLSGLRGRKWKDLASVANNVGYTGVYKDLLKEPTMQAAIDKLNTMKQNTATATVSDTLTSNTNQSTQQTSLAKASSIGIFGQKNKKNDNQTANTNSNTNENNNRSNYTK